LTYRMTRTMYSEYIAALSGRGVRATMKDVLYYMNKTAGIKGGISQIKIV
jgi:hypothetical protein